MDSSRIESSNWDDFVHSSIAQRMSSRDVVERFRRLREYFQSLPKNELIKRGWLNNRSDVTALSSLFFDFSESTTVHLYRKSPSANESLLTFWRLKAREKAEEICAESFPPAFIGLTKNHLRQIALLSPDPQIIRDLPRVLAALGVVLIFLPALPGMKADGVVFSLASGNPVIVLSLRFSRLDHFWFTLMHELAHLVLHAHHLVEGIVVDLDDAMETNIEKSANKLARESFAERSSWRSCEPRYQSGDESVVKYAEKIGIHASIVAGMLRKESGNYSKYSTLINSHDVRAILGLYE